MADNDSRLAKRWMLLRESSHWIKQHSPPGGNPVHQVVTLRGSPAGIGWQDQSGDSEFTKVTKVKHTLHTLFTFTISFIYFQRGCSLWHIHQVFQLYFSGKIIACQDKSITPHPSLFGITWLMDIQKLKLNRIIRQYYTPFIPWILSNFQKARSHQNKSKFDSLWDCSHSQPSKKSQMDYPLPEVVINCIDKFYIYCNTQPHYI